MRLQLGGLTIEAQSVGGVETCFQVPDFGLNLDIGRCPEGAIGQDRLLLTHAHIDHAAGLPYYVSMRSMRHQGPPDIYCPAASHPTLMRLLETWSELQADTLLCRLMPIEPGDRIQLPNDAFAQVFRSPHRISTAGYTLFRRIRKLKPEHKGKDGSEIGRLARSGSEIHEIIERAELCFPGDTTIDVLDSDPTVATARVLLLECTFLGGAKSPEDAKRGGHVHLDQIAANANRFENEHVVLTHFSKRYSPNEIRREVERKLPKSLLDRVQLLIHDP
jgi:ribonuclease Z